MFFHSDTQFTQAYKAIICEVIYQEKKGINSTFRCIWNHTDTERIFFFLDNVHNHIRKKSIVSHCDTRKSLGCLHYFIVHLQSDFR